MPKIFTQKHTYKHPFHNVTLAFWRKYPNEHSDHVKTVDTIDRKFDPKTGDLTIVRLIGCENRSMPAWLEACGVSRQAYAVEKTVVNAKNKTMEVRSRNVTMSSIMVVEEKCTYNTCEENKAHTAYKQEARITAFLPFIHGKIENYSLSTMQGRASQGLDVMESICDKVMKSGLEAFELFRSPVLSQPMPQEQ